MRTLLRSMVLLAAISGVAAQAQTITGTWQGTLQLGKELRTVIVISHAEGGGLRATFHPIDQGGQSIPASVVAFQGTTLTMAMAVMDAVYQGTLNGDAITGTFTQGGKPLPLTLTRATPETAWTIPGPPAPMAADAPAVFEVATIKPSNPDQPGKLLTVKGRQIITINTTLSDLITFAYGLHARQIVGGPDWMQSDKYDVTGQPVSPGQPSERQLRAMIQSLLADRFTLTFHRESRELPAYTITVARGGPKLTTNDGNPNGLPSLFFQGLGVLPGTNATMRDLAGVMQTTVMDRPVVDRTGLEGRYDFVLRWTPDETQFSGLGIRVPPPSNDPDAPPGLFTAFQEQLGLKLDSTRALVDVLIIDRVERPTEN